MTGYRFLTSPRWLGLAGAAVIVVIACGLLGHWQLTRHEARAAAIATVEANAEQEAVPLHELVDSTATVIGHDLEWRSVTVTGRYVGAPVVLPQRGIEGVAADHALGVLAIDGPTGTWLLVIDRGWYPTDAFADQSDRLDLPAGTVETVLRLRPAEEASTRSLPAGQVYRVAPEQVVAEAGVDAGSAAVVDGAYFWLTSEDPTTATAPTPLAVPAPNYRSNLSYAFQWWSLGVVTIIGFAVLARRERSADRVGPPAPTPPHRPRSDAEIEDAEIEAQLR